MIGTHGKLRDWMQKRVLDVRNVAILVFDEADEMLKVCVRVRQCSRVQTVCVCVLKAVLTRGFICVP